MATNFPGALDNSTSLPYPTALNGRNAPSLAAGQDNQNDALIAVETKLGSGSSVASNNNLLIGTGAGTSAWTKVAPAGTIVGTTDSQTLTNKTLTSPTINSPVITNANITTDLITGFTVSNTGTIFGVPVSTGVIQTASTVSGAALVASSIQTAALANATITPSKLNLSPQTSSVATNESTTSLTYVGLTTPQTFSVTVGANGLLLVAISALVFTSVGGPFDTYMSFSLSGANTLAASDGKSVSNKSANGVVVGATFLLTGLTPGATTVTALYRVSTASTGNFVNRNMTAVAL